VEPDRIRIKLLVDRLGAWNSEPLGLSYVDKEQKVQTLKTHPVSLHVLSNLGERPQDAQLRPIQDIIPVKARWANYFLWGVGSTCIILIILGVLQWVRKRRIGNISPEALDPPHIWAHKEIQQLEARRLFEKGEVKAFYFLFSGILRRYLESIRGFPAAEFTTEEISHHIATDQDRKLLPLLRQADLIKFADSVPTPARKEENIQMALSYIKDTSPAYETPSTREGPKEPVPTGRA
jgi:hypothetical protein